MLQWVIYDVVIATGCICVCVCVFQISTIFRLIVMNLINMMMIVMMTIKLITHTHTQINQWMLSKNDNFAIILIAFDCLNVRSFLKAYVDLTRFQPLVLSVHIPKSSTLFVLLSSWSKHVDTRCVLCFENHFTVLSILTRINWPNWHSRLDFLTNSFDSCRNDMTHGWYFSFAKVTKWPLQKFAKRFSLCAIKIEKEQPKQGWMTRFTEFQTRKFRRKMVILGEIRKFIGFSNRKWNHATLFESILHQFDCGRKRKYLLRQKNPADPTTKTRERVLFKICCFNWFWNCYNWKNSTYIVLIYCSFDIWRYARTAD